MPSRALVRDANHAKCEITRRWTALFRVRERHVRRERLSGIADMRRGTSQTRQFAASDLTNAACSSLIKIAAAWARMPIRGRDGESKDVELGRSVFRFLVTTKTMVPHHWARAGPRRGKTGFRPIRRPTGIFSPGRVDLNNRFRRIAAAKGTFSFRGNGISFISKESFPSRVL